MNNKKNNKKSDKTSSAPKRVRYIRQGEKLAEPGYVLRGVSKKGYQIFVLGGPPSAERDVADAIETTFGLERDLQLALRSNSNIEQLEHGLRITDGGKEQTVESGRIDIAAEDEHERR